MKLADVEEVAQQEETRREAVRYGVCVQFRTDQITAGTSNPRNERCGANRGTILTRRSM